MDTEEYQDAYAGFEAPRNSAYPYTISLDDKPVGPFVTKDSGERAEYASGMVRDTDKGKPRFDLLMPEGIPYADQMLTRFAELMAMGAEKYTDRNWERANSRAEVDRMRASAFRHFMQWYSGETDEDHAAAVFFNVMAAEATNYKILERANDLFPQRGAEPE